MQGLLRSILFLLFCLPVVGFSQNTTYRTQAMKAHKSGTVVPREVKEDFNPILQNLEMTVPGSSSARAKLQEIKLESAKRFSRKSATSLPQGSRSSAPRPVIGQSFEGNPYNNRVPNDNTVAISDGGLVISAINSTMVGMDVTSDTNIFSLSLASFSFPLLINGSKFDPKLIYDPNMDRYIIVFLNGNQSTTSKVILGFSSTNNPGDAWNLYSLEGNPFQDGTWSDYPAIAISNDELFLTLNQVEDTGSWQSAFNQSIIWQVGLQAGYNGDTTLNTRLWSNIEFQGNKVRNLHPVMGGSKAYGSNMYFLSNRNFDILNDTIFLLEITGLQDDVATTLTVHPVISNIPYGVPPNALQPADNFFDTNDGRILGAFNENGKIQFVSNSVDSSTGKAAVFHGIMTDFDQAQPTIEGHIIGDPVLDLGYPNIAYTGKQDCDDEAIIVFNHTATTVNPGFSAIYFSNNEDYSDIITLKEGENFVAILAGPYERWGDYSGIQRKYNEPGKVWATGSYGSITRVNGTWVSELTSPDTNIMSIALPDSVSTTAFQLCDASAQVTATGGNEPYTYIWDDNQGQTTATAGNLCAGTYNVTVTDHFDCAMTATVVVEEPEEEPVDPIFTAENTVFPNPVVDRLTVYFNLEVETPVDIVLFNAHGQLVKVLLEEKAKKGTNSFSFNTTPLESGMYFLKIYSGEEEVLSKKILKITKRD